MTSSSASTRLVDVLLVEDSPTDRLITRAALKNAGLDGALHMVGNGIEALAFLRREPPFTEAPRPQLILLDLNMPRMDGRELLEVLKRDPRLRPIPVVVLTTSASPDDIAAAYAAQANSYITKPVDFGEFNAAMRCLEQYWFEVAALPPQEAASSSDGQRRDGPAQDLVRPAGSPTLVLLVEDSSSDALICRKALEQFTPHAFEMVTAATLTDALAALSARQFDVVLTDLDLPELNGMDVVQALRRADAGVPIVVLTGSVGPAVGDDAIRAGADDYLHKGELQGTSLSRALRFAVQRRQVRDERTQLQRIEAVGRLAAGVAHDFNNLLAVIGGAADMLRADAEPEARGGLIDDITDTVGRGRALTRQLLSFTRQDRFDPRTLDLNDLIRTTSRLLTRLLGPHIPLQLLLDPSQPTVRADLHQLEQVLLNLCVNAADAMGGTGTITIRTETLGVDTPGAARIDAAMRPGRYLALRVEDDGPGIPAEIRGRIFEPFFTTKSDGRGTGLGLGTVRDIARQHGGAIDASNSDGDGTGATFTLYLPATEAPAEPVSSVEPAEPAPATPQAPGLAATTVLLVEDEAAILKIMSRMLTQQGFTVHSAESADAGWEIWEQHGETIDAVITDLLVPGVLSSIELIRRIHAVHPGLPVVFCSGYSEQFGNAGLDLREGENFVSKPFTMGVLLDTLEFAVRAIGIPPER